MTVSAGSAHFDLTVDPAKVQATLNQLRQEFVRFGQQASGIKVGITVDRSSVTAQMRAVVQQLQQTRIQLGVDVKPLTQAQARAVLGNVQAVRDVAVNVTGNAAQKLDEIKTKLAEIRAASTQALTINVGAVTALVQQLRQQVAELQRVENSLRTLRLNGASGSNTGGTGTGGGSSGRLNPYMAELKGWQTELRAGTATTAQFDQALANLQGRLQSELAALRSLGALTQEDAIAMNQMKAALAGVNTQINNTGIVKLRSDLAAARTSFEQAIAAAGRFNFVGQRQATQAYEAEIARLTQRIGAMGQQAGITQSQMRALNGISQQIASQQNAINGQFSQVGLAGNVVNALKSLPQFAMAAGGSLGAMAATGTQLSGVLGQISGLGGPVAAAIAGIGVAVFGLVKGFEDAIGHAAEFEKQLQQISGLAGLNGSEMGKYADYVQDLSTKLPVTTEQLTEFGRQAVLVGLHGPEGVKTFTQGMAELSTILRDVHGNAGGLEETGGEIVKVLRSMGMNTEEVNASFGKTINSLVALKTQFGVQIPDVTALATYFSSYAAKIGLTTDQILAFSASLVSVGARAQGSGSQLTKFFEKAAAAVASGGAPLKEFAKDLGLSEEATKNLLKTNPTAFLQRFAERLNVLHEQGVDSSVVLKGLGLDTNQAARTFNELAVASANTGRALQIAKKGFEEAGLSSKVAGEVSKNYLDQLKEMHNAVDGIKANLGAFAMPGLAAMAADVKGFTDNLLKLSQEAKRGGPILDELKGYVYALAAALIFLKAQTVAGTLSNWVTALGGAGQVLPTIIGNVRTLGTTVGAFGGRLSAAANAGMAFGGVRGAISGIATVLRSVQIAAGLAVGGLTLAVGAAVALAATVNRLQGQLQETYSKIDRADQDSHDAMMTRVNALIAQHTALGNAQAKYLLATDRLAEAQKGEFKGVSPLGERLYGPASEERVKKAQADLAASKKNLDDLTAAAQRHAALAGSGQKSVGQAVQLTKEQLKTQLSTIKDITAELSKPIKLFGGTEFQNQMADIAEKYRQLRDKLRQDVLDPKTRNALSRRLTVRQGEEQGEARKEYGSKASDAAAEAERQVQQARIQAMAEGSAKIRAQGEFDAKEAIRQATENAKQYRDFSAQKNRILKAGEDQAQMILAESHRKAKEADDKALKEAAASFKQHLQELVASQQKAEAALKKAHQDVLNQQSLERQLGNLLTNTRTSVADGKMTDAGLNSFTQQLEGIKAKINELPAPLQGVFTGLLQQAGGLKTAATAAAGYNAEVAKLKASVKDMGYDELVAAKNRVQGDATKARSLALIDAEIEKRQRLIKTQANVALNEGRLAVDKNAAQAIIDEYELAKARVKGRSDEAAQLLAIEQQSGAAVLAARQKLAQVAAEEEIGQVRTKYQKLIADAHGNSQKVAELTEQEGQQIAAIRQKRDREQQANKVASDQALIDQTRSTTAALLQLEKERQDGIRAVQSGGDNNTLGLYELGKTYAQSENGENLAARLDLEQRGGVIVLQARQNLARAAAQAEIEGLTISYQARIDREVAGSAEALRLAAERDTLIAQRGAALEIELTRLGREQLLVRAQAQKAFNDAMLKLDRDLQDGLAQRAKGEQARKNAQHEQDFQDDLKAAGNSAQARLAIYQREQTTRIAMQQQAQQLEEATQVEGENRRFDDLQKSQEWLSADQQRRENLTKDHQARLSEIAAQGLTDRAKISHDIAAETTDAEGKVNEERVKKQIDTLLNSLSDMTQGQRDASRDTLNGWLTTFTAMGAAGAAAADQIREALDKVQGANQDAIDRAGKVADELGMKGDSGRLDAFTLGQRLSDRTGKIGKPDSQADAEAKGREGYSSEIKALQDGIKKAQDSIAALEKIPVGKLTQQQSDNLAVLRLYLKVYQDQLPQTVQASENAGKKAGLAYITSQADAVAEGKLALATATKELAESQNKDGILSPAVQGAYREALSQYRDYWQGRVSALQAGVVKDASLQGELTNALQKLSGAQKNLTTDIQGGNKAEQQAAEGVRTLADAQDAYGAIFGRNALAYKSEIKSLEEAKQKYPELGAQLDILIGKYQQLQAARKGIVSAQSLKLDFKIGFSGGQKQLQDSISGVAKGFGSLLSPLSLLAGILDKVNPAGAALEAMFAVLEEPLKALQEPFKLIGELLGSIIAPVLEALSPILMGVVQVFGMVYDAIASFLKTISFGLINIKRRKTEDTPAEQKKVADQQQQNDLDDLDNQKDKKLISVQDYENRKFEIVKAGLERQRQADLDAAKNNAALQEQINRKYDIAVEKAHLDMLARLKDADEKLADQQQNIADARQQANQDQLELWHRLRIVSDADYERQKFALAVQGIENQRQADLRAAQDNEQLKVEINKKYNQAITSAWLDMLDKINAGFIQIGDNLMGNIQSGFKDGLMGALKAGNFGSFRTSLRKNLREAMFEAVLNAAIETAALKGILQPAIDALTAAFTTGDQGAINTALNGVLKAGDQVEAKAKGIYTALKPLRDKWGISGTTEDQKVEVVGNVSAPEVKISLDALALLGNVIQVQIPPFSEALLGNTEQLKLHTPALAAHTAAIPDFVTAVAAFGVTAQVYAAAGTQFTAAGERMYAASSNILTAANVILAAADRFDTISGGGKYGR